jgi:hypothetical protein
MTSWRAKTILSVVIVLVCGLISLTRADPFEPMADGSKEFDRQRCEFECRSRFGYELYSGRGSGSGAYWAFADCMAECDRKFWKQFDEDKKKLQE